MLKSLVSINKGKEYGLFFALPVVGLLLSIYTVVHHYSVKILGDNSFACNINQTFSCDTVALSAYSEIFSVPLGVYGVGYFLALWVLLATGLSDRKGHEDHLLAYTYTIIGGTLVSLVLAAISHFQLAVYCVSCLAVNTVCLLQLVALIVQRRKFPFRIDVMSLGRGSMTTLLVVVAVVALHNLVIRPRIGVSPVVEQGTGELATLGDTVHQLPINKSAYSGLGEDYRHGNDQAVVQVVEFVDFQCPSCKQMANVIDQLKKEYAGQVLFVFKNYPLDRSCNSKVNRGGGHKFACEIAIMARCAGQFGKFWSFHDLAFANQKQASEEAVVDWAKQSGLTDEQIVACRASEGLLDKIRDDISLAERVGVSGTPTLFINGRKYRGGLDVDQLRTELDRLLQ